MDRLYWLGIQILMPGEGRRVWSLIKHFGSARALWDAPEKEILSFPLTNSKINAKLVAHRKSLDLAREENKLGKAGVSYVTFDDDDYPKDLKFIHDPPPVLFLRGDIKVSGCNVAIVGSRKATPYGLMFAESIARDLANAGIVITSGLARGIDTAAHRGALSVRGKTIAVLGSGLDVPYPRENRKLMEEIVDQGGALVSEFPLGSAPESWHFPVRNRVISGLSSGILVVEAGVRSGALITTDLALEQGKDVYAVPGSVHNALSKGPHKLIKEGAKLVENAGDILEEIIGCGLFQDTETTGGALGLNEGEKQIYSLLTEEPVTLDELVGLTEMPLQKVISALMFLEIKKLVRKFPGGKYAAFKR